MSYRPQFPYKTPDGVKDEVYEHFFDQTNTPGLGVSLGAGDQINNIPLQIDPDAEFRWRGVQVGDVNSQSNLLVWFRDSQGNDLSDDFVPMQFYGGTIGPDTFGGGEAMPLEPEVVIPGGGIIRVSVLRYP